MIGSAIAALRGAYYAARIAKLVSQTKTYRKLKADLSQRRLHVANQKKAKAIADYLSGKKQHGLQLERPTPSIQQQNKVLNEARRADVARQQGLKQGVQAKRPAPSIQQQNKVLNQARRADVARQQGTKQVAQGVQRSRTR